MKEERLKQVESLIKIKVDAIIREELNDPRLALMSIVSVKLARELDSASIFISHPGDEKTRRDVEKILDTASRFIEGKLRNSIRLRRIPKLRFKLDDSMIYGARIDQLLNSIQEERNQPEQPNTKEKTTDDE